MKNQPTSQIGVGLQSWNTGACWSAVAAVLLATMISGGANLLFPSAARAQEHYVVPSDVTLIAGEVTAIRHDELSIDGKDYSLVTGATVVDDTGRFRELNDFVPGTQVKYQLKSGKIDLIVLIMPK